MIKISTLISANIQGLPPTVNHMYRTRGHYRYKTADARDYQERASCLLSEKWGSREPYSGAVALYIKFTTNNHIRWDIDNRVKALQDCLSMAGIIKDDTQIQLLHVERIYGDSDSTEINLNEHDVR